MAFTATELLVVITVIGALLSLALIGIGAAREASRKLECQNRLRQLVLACQLFESSQRILPRGWNDQADPSVPQDPRGLSILHSSGFWRLLPYFDQEKLSQQVRYVRMQGGSAETTELMPPETRVRLSIFLCPSDPVSEGTNYRFNGGSNPACFGFPSLPASLRPNGPFGLERTISLASVRGGTSATVAFSERLKAPGVRRYNHRANIWGAGLTNEFRPHQIDHALLHSLATALGTREPSEYSRLAGLNWHGGGKMFTVYDHVFTPNRPAPAICSGSSRSTIFDAIGAVPPTSLHRGGVNAAMLDGSVRFVADAVDGEAWSALGRIN